MEETAISAIYDGAKIWEVIFYRKLKLERNYYTLRKHGVTWLA